MSERRQLGSRLGPSDRLQACGLRIKRGIEPQDRYVTHHRSARRPPSVNLAVDLVDPRQGLNEDRTGRLLGRSGVAAESRIHDVGCGTDPPLVEEKPHPHGPTLRRPDGNDAA
jgi:hypothetical protein